MEREVNAWVIKEEEHSFQILLLLCTIFLHLTGETNLFVFCNSLVVLLKKKKRLCIFIIHKADCGGVTNIGKISSSIGRTVTGFTIS